MVLTVTGLITKHARCGITPTTLFILQTVNLVINIPDSFISFDDPLELVSKSYLQYTLEGVSGVANFITANEESQ